VDADLREEQRHDRREDGERDAHHDLQADHAPKRDAPARNESSRVGRSRHGGRKIAAPLRARQETAVGGYQIAGVNGGDDGDNPGTNRGD
jgi:hypothetical protein